MGAVWKDTTSYSQNERGKVAPRAWSCEIDGVDITIHHHIYYEANTWLLRSRYINISEHELDNKGVNEAKEEALSTVKNTIKRKICKLQKQLDSFD